MCECFEHLGFGIEKLFFFFVHEVAQGLHLANLPNVSRMSTSKGRIGEENKDRVWCLRYWLLRVGGMGWRCDERPI